MNTERLRTMSEDEAARVESTWLLSKEKEQLDDKRRRLVERIELKSAAAYSRRA